LPIPDAKPKPHTRLVLDALNTSGLPPELRHVIRVMCDLADRKTGVGRRGHKHIASCLGCSVRSLIRYQREIRELPGDPWVTWRRTAARNGMGRGRDEYTVRVGTAQVTPVARKPRGQRWPLGVEPKVTNATDQGDNGAAAKVTAVSEQDPVSDPVLIQEEAPPPPKVVMFRTDGAGTRRVDPFAASFARPSPIVAQTFQAWTKAFGKEGAHLDPKRSAILTGRVETGMTQQDADDAISGALVDDWITGRKDGKRHDVIGVIFGDAERYEEFRDRGRSLRLGEPPVPEQRPRYLDEYTWSPGQSPFERAEREAARRGTEDG